ncbi:IS5 family transposase [Geodermatophilus sabuli]|uniref:IS5 family transposase n=1 Tax=Geodermatophilus sabuli TaxID=1564158 RepID=A0A7K3W5T9_9ACTN|nr:IS5 family transposase [Geodermatophilus sabuli]
MIKDLVPDRLWKQIAPLLPPPKPRRYRHPGRRPVDDRAALAGIVFVLKTGIAWNQLPASVVGCSGITCWRRLRDWTAAGVWPALHEQLLAQLRALGELNLDVCAIDGSHVRALKGGPRRGPSPVDRARPGCKHRLICDAGGLPLAVSITGGNRNDVTQLLPLVDAIPPIRGLRGRPRRRPRQLLADRGYDYDIHRRQLRDRGITPKIARRGVAHGSGLGKQRWVVERGFAWLHAFKRLRTRYERRADLHLGLLQLACALICFRHLDAILK